MDVNPDLYLKQGTDVTKEKYPEHNTELEVDKDVNKDEYPDRNAELEIGIDINQRINKK